VKLVESGELGVESLKFGLARTLALPAERQKIAEK
jgi:hypothetical protein